MFEDPGEFASIILPNQGLKGIAGVVRVNTYLVVPDDDGGMKSKALGMKRPYFAPRSRQYHFNAPEFFRSQSCLNNTFDSHSLREEKTEEKEDHKDLQQTVVEAMNSITISFGGRQRRRRKLTKSHSVPK